MKLYTLLFIFTSFTCCSPLKLPESLQIVQVLQKKTPLTVSEKENWYKMNYKYDTIPGISMNRAYNIFKNKQSIIVGVVDTEININHPLLKGAVWVNKDEIYGDTIDNDNNGYINDINGWNFLGATNSENLVYEHFEYTRIVKDYENRTDLEKKSIDYTFEDYKNALVTLNEKIAQREKDYISDSTYMEDLIAAEKRIHPIKRKDLSPKILDSLEKVREDLEKDIATLRWATKYNYSIENAKRDVKMHNRYRKYYNNVAYNERILQGDNPNDINDCFYGNNNVSYMVDVIDHGTGIAGLIKKALTPENKLNPIADFKIMPVVVAAYGHAHDKDIALAMRYAVDNGATILNVSISKEFSLHKTWIFDAIKYAASKDVLIINSSGNGNTDLDINKNYYPNDTDYIANEIADNFIMVGGSSLDFEKGFSYKYTNYGKENVDVLAPATEIYTSTGSEGYKFTSGTSVASPLVTSIAILIRANYPKLTAAQVKKIILTSGTSYNLKVNLSNGKDNPKIVTLESLTKSGKIVNAYNALLTADAYIKNK